MKLKHTQARKANTRAFRSNRGNSNHSERRAFMRQHLQPKKFKTFGCQVTRIQRVFLKPDRFGMGLCGVRIRFVKHADA